MDSKLNSPDASSPNRTLLRDLENANSSASLGSEGKLTFASSMRSFFLDSWINLLLVFVPLGIISYVLNWSPVAVFFLNFFAIVPLSKMLGTATEEIALKTNDVIGGLLNATFGNAVELIISIIALKDGLIRVVQASLLGSILSNLLLVCGFCFFLGGLKFKEQQFNVTNAQTASSLLTLSVLAIMIPGMFGLLAEHDDGTPTDKDDITLRIISMSRGTSIVLLVVYAMYLYFQLKSHRYLVLNEQESSGEEEEEEQKMTLPAAIIGLVSVTLIISFLAEFLVSSIEGFSEKLGLSETFIGLILVPIVGNAAEHVSAVTVAMKNKMELSLAVALGSSLQIALFMIPFTVIVGWFVNKDMTLDFHGFESAVLFLSVLITNYLIQDGKSNYLEGFMMLASYLIIAIAFFYYP